MGAGGAGVDNEGNTSAATNLDDDNLTINASGPVTTFATNAFFETTSGDSVTANHTLYVYQPGQGISKFEGAATDTPGSGTPAATCSGTSSSYTPEAGLRWQWVRTAGLSRTVTDRPDGGVASASDWNWDFPSTAPNDPWSYVDPSTFGTTLTPTAP